MKSKYIINLNQNGCVEAVRPNSSVLVYRIPYKEFQKQIFGMEISNRFIVYILIGYNNINKEKIIYVGKSKNGIDNRPTAHEKENYHWENCYILTSLSEKTFLNDAAILYIENKIHNILKSSAEFETVTKTTTYETANYVETEFCDEFLAEAIKMLFILGLDFGFCEEAEVQPVITNELSDIVDAFTNKIF